MYKGLLGIGLMIFLLWQCASKATPPGGPKDETPPRVVEDNSTPNKQVNFQEKTIVITLDEWVELEDAQNQVLISPPLQRRPDIRIKKRSVVFSFHDEEELRENATYSINFGEAIRDITERNVLKNYSFVFSTGDKLDSFSVQGMIVDAYSGEPVENATIMLYESLEDTIPLKEKPFYATKSDESGSWRIENMKGGTFRVVGIVDDNLNYLMDPTERMAFLDSFLTVNGDSLASVNLLMSTPVEPLYQDRRDTSGWNQARFTYNRRPYELVVSYAEPDQSLFMDRQDNVLNIWYYSESRREWPLYFRIDTMPPDTFLLKFNAPKPELKKISKQSRLSNTGHPAEPFHICFDRPVSSLDTSRILLLEGRTAATRIVPDIEILDSLPMCLRLQNQWKPDSTYQLILLPGALNDFYQMENDTLEESFPIGNVERFGNIILHVEGLSEDQSYLVEIGVKDKPELQFSIDSVTTFDRTLSRLRPATYEIRISEDRNRNGRWDPGSFLEMQQPEPTRKESMEPLRANWELEVNFKWSDR